MAEVVSVEKGMVKTDVKLNGKTVLITGANSGIGFWTSVDMAKRGAKVVMACRNPERAEDARKRVVEEAECEDNLVVTKSLDLNSFDSINKFVDDFLQSEDKLNILINNAGVMTCPQGKTADGFETQFGVNHLGHFLLTNRLLDLIKKSVPSRIVVVSSVAHAYGSMNFDDLNYETRGYSEMGAYAQSKLANILFSRHLSQMLEGTGVTVNSLHPGYVDTELQRHMKDGGILWRAWLFFSRLPGINHLLFKWKTPVEGAQTSIYCAVAPELDGVTGKYFSDCAIIQEAKAARKNEDAKKLWDVSLKLTKLSESARLK